MKLNFALLLLAALTAFLFAGGLLLHWDARFDDAFISFRYSQNLADGYGLRWNRDGPPTEGYTNALLVFLLAPALKLGLDPLLVTRILAFLSIAVICGLLYHAARQAGAERRSDAALIASAFLLVPKLVLVSVTGLETVHYAAALFATVVLMLGALNRPSRLANLSVGAALCIAMLLRPEAVLIFACLTLAILLFAPGGFSDKLRATCEVAALPFVVGAAYVVWKYLYFGDVFPNPFYLKVASDSGASGLGLKSVFDFALAAVILLVFVAASALLCFGNRESQPRYAQAGVVIALASLGVYLAFFSRTETLMDIGGRFLFPLYPIAILGATPVLLMLIGMIRSKLDARPYLRDVLLAALIVVSAQGGLSHLMSVAGKWMSGEIAAGPAPYSLMNRENTFAQGLAEYPGIEEVKIAFGDAGVIAYETGAIWLDPVGLNDNFIARTRDRAALVDYFFDFGADLIIVPSTRAEAWYTSGHGVLGDMSKWFDDPRWDSYGYIGTVETDRYDLELLLRRDTRFVDLQAFIVPDLIDSAYARLPYPLGTYQP